jgi:hypothetical protein
MSSLLTTVSDDLRQYAIDNALPIRKDGSLDMRKKCNKDAHRLMYIRKITALQTSMLEKNTKIKQLEIRVNKQNKIIKTYNNPEQLDKEDTDCLICCDVKIGTATLSCCGQEICISCFAKHSRVNNTCPFCRTEYAPKVKKPNKLCEITLNAMADEWAGQVSSQGYFHNQQLYNNIKPNQIESERHLEWLVRENGKILMTQVKNWYDAEFD